MHIYFKLISYKVMWEEGIKRWIKRLANRKNQPGIWNQSIGKREIEKQFDNEINQYYTPGTDYTEGCTHKTNNLTVYI